MTGFGAASRAWSDGPGGRSAQLGVEIRGVNQRFLEIKLRSPFGAATEQELRRRIEARVGRGRIDASIFVQREESSGAGALDEARVLEVLAASRRIAALAGELGLMAAPVNPLQVLGMVGAPARAQAGSEGPMAPPGWLIECVDEAIDGLVAMREAEGAALCEVLLGLVEALEAQVTAIKAAVVSEGERLHVRLCERITALCARAGVEPLPPDRLAQEIAVVVQRSDITEELDRLGSHVGQVRGVLAGSAQVGQGKTLDFLTQELFREVTTIGSKISAHAGSALVIAAKGTIERIREQVQNVE
jgi:uncharacterized protein (TIGR00255 family)